MLASLHGVSLRGRNSASQHCRGVRGLSQQKHCPWRPGMHCPAALHSTGRISSTHNTRRAKTSGCAEDGPHGSRARFGTQLGPRCSVEDTASRLQPRCCSLRAAASQPRGCSLEATASRLQLRDCRIMAATSRLKPRGCSLAAAASRLQLRGCIVKAAVPRLHRRCCSLEAATSRLQHRGCNVEAAASSLQLRGCSTYPYSMVHVVRGNSSRSVAS